MQEPAIKVYFSLEHDESAGVYEGTAIRRNGRLWFVCTWIQLHPTSGKVPQWLFPLDGFADFPPPNGAQVALKRAIAGELVDHDTPPEIRRRLGAMLNPAILNDPGFGSTH